MPLYENFEGTIRLSFDAQNKIKARQYTPDFSQRVLAAFPGEDEQSSNIRTQVICDSVGLGNQLALALSATVQADPTNTARIGEIEQLHTAWKQEPIVHAVLLQRGRSEEMTAAPR